MILTIFRSRLRPEHVHEYEQTAQRIEALARTMPGFVSIKTFAAGDGERVSIVEFSSREAHDAWRSHPEHLRAQELGREKFYSFYSIDVCDPVRRYSWELEP
ncbi:MAG TPA: antibiotic biosynthesis monooxygenase [Candidatus Limnocylindrales bacterium]|nr:antibiotic biosynthesis monooxygenase [Candidatus Limnocylindrales bacterium]